MRLITTPALIHIYGVEGMNNRLALEILDGFLRLPSIAYREEPVGLEPIWYRLADRATASPKLWMDAYLAAFAIASGLTLVTLDKDFKAFESGGLKLNLLVAS